MSRKINVEEKIASNLYSSHYLLKALSEFYEEALPQTEIKTTQRWSNIRLSVLFIACSAALYGQFGVSFPQDYWKIAAAVCAYFAFSTIATVVDYFVTKGAEIVVVDKYGEVFVLLKMNSGQSHITMNLRRRGRKGVDYKLDLSKLFEEDGTLVQSAALAMLTDNLNSFSATSSATSKKTN